MDYAANPEKTEYGGLAQALHYAENEGKTVLEEKGQLVSGIHCHPERAWEEMREVQEHFGKTQGVVAMHAYQSFRPGEVTPEQCHQLGMELARRVWGSRFQVLVATHMNTQCLHNHFIINSVSYVDGKKYEQKRSQYHDLRKISDEICEKAGLSVIQTPRGKTPRPLYEAEKRGEPTRYNQMRKALRTAMSRTSTQRDFVRVLYELGYRWNQEDNRKYATLQPLDGGRAVRLYWLGKEYDWPVIQEALAGNLQRFGPHYYDLQWNPRYSLHPAIPKPPRRRIYRYRGSLQALRQKSSLFRLYLHYCYRLGIYPKRTPPKVNWPEINAIWRDTEKLAAELLFLNKHHFRAVEEVEVYRDTLAQQIEERKQERDQCIKALRRKEPPLWALQRRSQLTRELKCLREEDKTAQRVIQRIQTTLECRRQLQQQMERQKEQRKQKRCSRVR